MADQSDRPEPDFDEDPRKGEVSDAGYPESAPEGVAGDTGFPDEGAEHGGESLEQGRTPSPSTSSEREGGSRQATGNPRAAGE